MSAAFVQNEDDVTTKENFDLLFSPLVRHSSALPQASGQAAQTALALEYMNVDMMTMVAPSANAAFGSNPCDGVSKDSRVQESRAGWQAAQCHHAG